METEEKATRSDRNCQYCDETFSNVKKLVIHRADYHKIVTEECDPSLSNEGMETEGTKSSLSIEEMKSEELTTSVSTKHMETKQKETMSGWNCQDCDDIFPDKVKLESHQVDVHNINMVPKCEICSKLFKNKKGLNKHRINNHTEEYQASTCSDCSQCFRYIGALITHQKSAHGETGGKYGVNCEQCGKTFSEMKNLDSHRSAVHVFDTQICHMCSSQFRNKTYLRNHIRLTHGVQDEPAMCSDCGKSCKNKYRLAAHKKDMHEDIVSKSDKQCEDCEKAFSNIKRLISHRRSVHSNDPQMCDLCSKQFKNKDNLRNHNRMIHVKEDQVVCNDCGKSFKSKSYLATHRKGVHEQGSDDVCHICNTTYKNKYALKKHIRICTKRPKAKPTSYVNGKSDSYPPSIYCGKCDKHFVSPKYFRQHNMYSHQSGQTECMLCFQNVKNTLILRQHMRRQHQITDSNTIRTMTQSHNSFGLKKEKPFHEKHEMSGQLCCAICGKSLKTSDNIKKHLRRTHNMNDSDQIQEMVEKSRKYVYGNENQRKDGGEIDEGTMDEAQMVAFELSNSDMVDSRIEAEDSNTYFNNDIMQIPIQ